MENNFRVEFNFQDAFQDAEDLEALTQRTYQSVRTFDEVTSVSFVREEPPENTKGIKDLGKIVGGFLNAGIKVLSPASLIKFILRVLPGLKGKVRIKVTAPDGSEIEICSPANEQLGEATVQALQNFVESKL